MVHDKGYQSLVISFSDSNIGKTSNLRSSPMSNNGIKSVLDYKDWSHYCYSPLYFPGLKPIYQFNLGPPKGLFNSFEPFFLSSVSSKV